MGGLALVLSRVFPIPRLWAARGAVFRGDGAAAGGLGAVWKGNGRAEGGAGGGEPAPVLLVGMDRNFLASEAAFYDPDQRKGVRESSSMHYFNRISLMYELWFPPREALGATLLLVGWDRETLDEPRVQKRCGTLGPIERVPIVLEHGRCAPTTRAWLTITGAAGSIASNSRPARATDAISLPEE